MLKNIARISLIGPILALLLALPVSADAFHDRLNAAKEQLSQGLFDDAVKGLDEMKVDYPDQPVLDYALGTAQYLAEQAEAFIAWEKASPPAAGVERVLIAGDPERARR